MVEKDLKQKPTLMPEFSKNYLAQDLQTAATYWDNLGATDKDRAKAWLVKWGVKAPSDQAAALRLHDISKFSGASDVTGIDTESEKKRSELRMRYIEEHLIIDLGSARPFHANEFITAMMKRRTHPIAAQSEYLLEVQKSSANNLMVFGMIADELKDYIENLKISNWTDLESFKAFAQYHNHFRETIYLRLGGESYVREHRTDRFGFSDFFERMQET